MSLVAVDYADSESAFPFSKYRSPLPKIISWNIVIYYVRNRKFSGTLLLRSFRRTHRGWFRVLCQKSKIMHRSRHIHFLTQNLFFIYNLRDQHRHMYIYVDVHTFTLKYTQCQKKLNPNLHFPIQIVPFSILYLDSCQFIFHPNFIQSKPVERARNALQRCYYDTQCQTGAFWTCIKSLMTKFLQFRNNRNLSTVRCMS